jgi:hypothetical protein
VIATPDRALNSALCSSVAWRSVILRRLAWIRLGLFASPEHHRRPATPPNSLIARPRPVSPRWRFVLAWQSGSLVNRRVRFMHDNRLASRGRKRQCQPLSSRLVESPMSIAIAPRARHVMWAPRHVDMDGEGVARLAWPAMRWEPDR